MRGLLLAVAGASALVSGAQPSPASFRLPSGLPVVLLTDGLRPLVRITLRIEVPESLSAADLRFLAAALARSGAGPHSAAAFRSQRSAEGHAWRFEVRGRALVWSVLADSQDQEGAAELLAHGVVRPDLIEGWKRLQAEANAPGGRATLLAAVEPDPSRWPKPEGGSLGRLLALGTQVLRPERAILTLQGDATLAQARQLALLQFGTWQPGAPDPLPDPAPRWERPRVLLAPGPEGRILQAGLEPVPGSEALQAAVEILLAHRLSGLFAAGPEGLLHRRALAGTESFPQSLRALLAEVERRLSAPAGPEDLRALEAGRSAADLHRRLEPARALDALPEALSLAQIGPLLSPASIRERLVVLLEGAGPEDQAALADLGLGPVQRFDR